jgi:hypothetical protein
MIVSPTTSSSSVKPRRRWHQQSPPFRVTQQVLDAPAPVQPAGKLVVLRALAWSIVYAKPAMPPVAAPVAVTVYAVGDSVQLNAKYLTEAGR